MLRKSLMVDHGYISMLMKDRLRCKWIALLIILQCFIVYAGAISILYCYWSPEKAYFEDDKLARIMYLFDYQSCDYALDAPRTISNLRLPNDTFGGNVLPIKWRPADVTVSTRLSAKTRIYIEISMGIHGVWITMAFILYIITRSSKNAALLKFTLLCFLFINVWVIMFDVSMAIVYIAHIQQSLTKGMVVRYSGWSVDFHVEDPNEFAGWLPICASILWLRGIIFLFWNTYCCKLIYQMRNKMKRFEVKRQLKSLLNEPIPEANPKLSKVGKSQVLYYRTGDIMPEKQTYSFL